MLLEIQDISKSYSKKGTVLDHISFQMREGIYGLLGPNGAGKTTLMNIMTANLQPDGGCVMYNGEDIKKQGKQNTTNICSKGCKKCPYKSPAKNSYKRISEGRRKSAASKQAYKVIKAYPGE